MSNTTISNIVICNKDLSDAAFRLYCILVMLAGKEKQVNIYLSKLAESCGKSQRTVRMNINELIQHGLITRIHCMSKDIPNMNIANLYIINDLEDK